MFTRIRATCTLLVSLQCSTSMIGQHSTTAVKLAPKKWASLFQTDVKCLLVFSTSLSCWHGSESVILIDGSNFCFSFLKVFSDVGKWAPELVAVDHRQDRVQMSRRAQYRSNMRADHHEKRRLFHRNIQTDLLRWVMNPHTLRLFESEAA